jgi:hypothetical protein
MYTQITCPNCGTPYTAEVHQIIDAQRTPHLKQQLLQGQLNVAVCPQCGAGGQMTSLLAYHDLEHELFMIYLPQELNIDEAQREEAIGKITREITESLPQEDRKYYLFQPQIILSMKTFMEKVLATEGITPEMIARQEGQMELLQTLAGADKDVRDHLIEERIDEIDETFFAMLQSFIDAVAQTQDTDQLIKLTNLRAKLMMDTAVGREVEKRQIALHKFSQEAKEKGLSPQLLFQHVMVNRKDDGVVEALVTAGASALQYEFFNLLSLEIEKAELAGNPADVEALTALREKLLAFYEQIQNAQQQVMLEAMAALDAILAAPDREQALMEQLQQGRIGEEFMAVLMARLSEAQQNDDAAETEALMEIYTRLQAMSEQQMPPEVQFINDLLQTESAEAQTQMLDDNEAFMTAEMVELLDRLMGQMGEAGQEELSNSIQSIKTQIEARL